MQKNLQLFEIGSRGSEPGLFTWPRGVAVGPDNTIVVADSSNHRVQVFDSNGKFIKEFGQYGSGEGEFDCLAGVAVNRIGQYIIADRYNHRIQVNVKTYYFFFSRFHSIRLFLFCHTILQNAFCKTLFAITFLFCQIDYSIYNGLLYGLILNNTTITITTTATTKSVQSFKDFKIKLHLLFCHIYQYV